MMKEYRLEARAKNFGEYEEVAYIKSTSPELAITKAMILKGKDFYDRLYWIAEVDRSEGFEQWEEVARLCSYGMCQEKMRRSFGRKVGA